MHCATAAGPEVAHAWRDGVKGVQRLAKRWQGQRLHMPFNISVGLIRAAAGKAAEGGGWHRHRSSPLQGKLQAHHDACERVAVETVHCAAIGVLGRRQDSHGTEHIEFGVEFSVRSPAAVHLVHHAQLQMILQVLPHTITCALHAHTRSLQHARWSYTADLLLKSHDMNPRS